MDPSFFTILLLSITPVIEGRYALPTAVALGYDPVVTYCAVTLATITLAFVLSHALWLLDKFARNIPYVSELWVRYLEKTRKKVRQYVERYGSIGLILFVAVPFPGTGVWTGSIAGYVLGIPPRKLALCTAAGGIISNTAVLLSTMGLCYFV